MAAATDKTFAMLAQSPYKDRMGNASLSLKALASRAQAYPNLIRANLGNQIASAQGLLRLQSRRRAGPRWTRKSPTSLPPCPWARASAWTHGRTRLPYCPPNLSRSSERDKLPFEITPFMNPLWRVEAHPSGSR